MGAVAIREVEAEKFARPSVYALFCEENEDKGGGKLKCLSTGSRRAEQ